MNIAQPTLASAAPIDAIPRDTLLREPRLTRDEAPRIAATRFEEEKRSP
jgi:hypothetical protein